jgi:DNA-binding transcriptional regulator YiaG
MPNFAATLRQEIARLARKEIKAHVRVLRSASTHYRKDIAALKREAAQLRSALGRLARTSARAGAATPLEEGPKIRFSARSVVAQRKRLGLSAAAFGQLAGVSAITVYNWENGKSKPRASQLAKLAQVRKIGKRAAKQALGADKPAKARRKKRAAK